MLQAVITGAIAALLFTVYVFVASRGAKKEPRDSLIYLVVVTILIFGGHLLNGYTHQMAYLATFGGLILVGTVGYIAYSSWKRSPRRRT